MVSNNIAGPWHKETVGHHSRHSCLSNASTVGDCRACCVATWRTTRDYPRHVSPRTFCYSAPPILFDCITLQPLLSTFFLPFFPFCILPQDEEVTWLHELWSQSRRGTWWL